MFGASAEELMHGSPDVRVAVHRVDDLNGASVALGKIAQRQTHAFQRFPEVFAAMRGDQHGPGFGVSNALSSAGSGWATIQRRASIPGLPVHQDVLGRHVLAQQVVAGALGRREVAVGDDTRNTAVDLLWERLPAVARPQPSLDVADAAASVEGRQRRRGNGRGIALNEHPVGSLLAQDGFESSQDARRHLGRRLVVLHDVEVVLGLNVEDTQHLIQHVAVLGGDAHAAHDALRMPRQLAHDGSELDRLGSGAEDGQNLERLRHAAILLYLIVICPPPCLYLRPPSTRAGRRLENRSVGSRLGRRPDPGGQRRSCCSRTCTV